MKKKWLALAAILTFAALLCGTSFAASAAGTNEITFELKYDTILEVSGSGSMTDYGSAEETPWYQYRSVVDTVLIEGNITSIGAHAFEGFENLTYVEISNCVKTVGTSAFADCENLSEVSIGRIGTQLEEIGASAFAGCEALESFSVPGSLRVIGDSAFANTGLQTISLNSVAQIGARAFAGCPIEEMIVPSSVASLSEQAFDGCDSLKRIVVCADAQVWEDVVLSQNVTVRFHDFHPSSSGGSVCAFCYETDADSNLFWNDMDREQISGEMLRPATHFVTGVEKIVCPDCGKSETREIPKSEEHDFTDHYEKVDETHHKAYCKCGEADPILREHSDWVSVDANTHKRDCVCEDPQTQDHDWKQESETPASHLEMGKKYYTCTVCGETRTEDVPKLTEHTFKEPWVNHDAGRHKQLCACGVARYESHHWDDGVVTLEPTHLTTGEKTHHCAECGAVKTEPIPKLTEHTFEGEWMKHDAEHHKQFCACGEAQYETHDWDDGTVTQEPTHLTLGVKTFYCTVCGETRTEDVPKLTEHSFSTDWTKHDGGTHKQVCACGEELHKQHAWDNGKVTKPASHTAEGKMQLTCLLCGATKEEKIEKLSEHVYAKNWTAEETGHSKKCSCGHVLHEDHRYGEWVIEEATEENEGKREKTCTACGYVVSEVIPAIEKNEGLSTGGVIGVTVSFAVVLGVGGFWIVSPELMGTASPIAPKKKRAVRSAKEKPNGSDPT